MREKGQVRERGGGRKKNNIKKRKGVKVYLKWEPKEGEWRRQREIEGEKWGEKRGKKRINKIKR